MGQHELQPSRPTTLGRTPCAGRLFVATLLLALAVEALRAQQPPLAPHQQLARDI
jgi:hypothetical protein